MEDEDWIQFADHAFSASHLADDLRDTIWIVDNKQDDLLALIERMKLIAKHLFPVCAMDFEAPKQLPVLLLHPEWRRNVFYIYKEALHNAAQHAQATQVTVKITLEEDVLAIKIKDNGIGFEPETVRQGRGLKNLHDRAKQVDGTLKIMSRKGSGTRLDFQVKILCPRSRSLFQGIQTGWRNFVITTRQRILYAD